MDPISHVDLIHGLRSGTIQNDKVFVDALPLEKPGSPFYVICNSIPKAGTYLLVELVKALGGHLDVGYHCYDSAINKVNDDGRLSVSRKIPAPLWSSALNSGYFCAAHVAYDPLYEQFLLSRREHKMLFIIRDPRDLVISWVDFVYNSNSYIDMSRWNSIIRRKGEASFPDDDSKIAESIRSLPRSDIMDYLNWVDSPACKTIRFEELYMELTDRSLQAFPVLDGICDYLEVRRRSPNQLAGVTYRSLTRSSRAKKVAVYRERMNEQHRRLLLADEFQRMVVEFGYEPTPEPEPVDELAPSTARESYEKTIAVLVDERERATADSIAEREAIIAAFVVERETIIAKLVEEREAITAMLVGEREETIAELQRRFAGELETLTAKLVAERERQIMNLVRDRESVINQLVADRERLVSQLVAERDDLAKQIARVAADGEAIIAQVVIERDAAVEGQGRLALAARSLMSKVASRFSQKP